MVTEKKIEIKVIPADSKKNHSGEVWIAGSLVGTFSASDSVRVKNVEIDMSNEKVDENKLDFSVTENAISSANQRRKLISKKFSLPISKLNQLKKDSNPEISKAMKRLVPDDIEQVIIEGVKLRLKTAME